MRLLKRLALFGVLLINFAVVAIPATVASAAGTSLVTESFTTGTTVNSWTMPTGSSGVCLTGGSNTSATPIPDCGTNQSPGALQLTTNAATQVGTVYNGVAVPTANGLDISWTSYQFDGTGADGISFDLAAVNPTNPTAPATVGPSGGSLGYSTNQSANGVPYGYLGFGADVYGNFENSSGDGGTNCAQSNPAAAESLGVRGPGNGTTGYCLLAKSTLSGSLTLDDKSATTRGSGTTSIGVPEEVVLNPTGAAITASVSGFSVPAGDWMFATEPLSSDKPGTTWTSLEGALPKSPTAVPTSWLNSTTDYPQELAFGWAASTGGANEYHQINLLQVSSLTASPSLAISNTDSGSGVLSTSTPTTVTLTPSVSNSSAASEADPVVVTDTFPASLTPTAASGTSWTCTVTSPSISCTYTPSTPIAAGTSLPPISVSVTPGASATSFTDTAEATSQDAAPATAVDSGLIKAAQTIHFTTTAPTHGLVGSTYSAAATSTSGLTVALTVDATSSSICSISGGVVTLNAAGTCLLDANQAGNSSYKVATQVQQSFMIQANQTVAFTSSAPVGALVNGTYTPSATASSALTATITVDATASAVCSISSGVVTFNAGGVCVLDANQAGNGTYTTATQVQQSFSVGKLSQTVAFTSTSPTAAIVGGSTYSATASATSTLGTTLSVAAASSSVCTISGGVVSFIGGGTCTLDANQAGNTHYNAATQAAQSFTVAATQTVAFTSSAPAAAEVAGAAYSVSASATSSLPATITVDASASSVCSISGNVVSFSANGICILDANQAGGSTGGLTYVAAPQVRQSFTVQVPDAVTFTTTAPSSAGVGGPTYTATAFSTNIGSTPVTVDGSSSAICSISGGVVTFTSPGVCTLDASDGVVLSQQSFTVAGTQSVAFSTTAPTPTVGGSGYTPGAIATSGLTATISVDGSSSSVCTISGGVVTFSSGGICTLDANQAGGSTGGLTYVAATQVQQSFNVAKVAQSVSFTTTAPTAAVVNGTYVPTSSATSSLTPVITVDASSSSVCVISSGTVSFTGSGTCTLDSNQPGNGGYNPATQVQQSFSVAQLTQTVSFTSTAPTGAVIGGTYAATASATSGLSVAITVDGSSSSVCSISAGTVSFTTAGLCVLDANQAGNSSYPLAVQVQQDFVIAQSQTVAFTSTDPVGALYGLMYTPTATATSGLTAAITVNASSASVCAISGGVVRTLGVGTCLLEANQAGDTNFIAAPQTPQSFNVGQAVLSVTASSPTITVGGTVAPVVTPIGLIGSDAISAVTYTYAGTNTTTYGPSTTAPTAVGTYSITPTAAVFSTGSTSNYAITYSPGVLTINAVVHNAVVLDFTTIPSDVTTGQAPGTFAVVASATPNVGTVTYSSSTSAICGVGASGQLTVLAPGTCTINANDTGQGAYLPATQITESFNVTQSAIVLAFTTATPGVPTIGGIYRPAAADGVAGSTVTLSIDPSSTSGCTYDKTTRLVTFAAPAGTCVIDASATGAAGVAPPGPVHQTIRYSASASGAAPGRGVASTTLHFANNSSALNSTSRSLLLGLARAIKAHGLTQVSITGFASSTGVVSGNLVLGINRATVAAAYLKTLLAGMKVTGIHMSISGIGAAHFVANPPSAAANRRTQLDAN